jgi:hypothetical protein
VDPADGDIQPRYHDSSTVRGAEHFDEEWRSKVAGFRQALGNFFRCEVFERRSCQACREAAYFSRYQSVPRGYIMQSTEHSPASATDWVAALRVLSPHRRSEGVMIPALHLIIDNFEPPDHPTTVIDRSAAQKPIE